MYVYDRQVTASMSPTVEAFLLILKANVIQSDEAQRKRDLQRKVSPNPYALGLALDAVSAVEKSLSSKKDSSSEADLLALKAAIQRAFNDTPPVRKTLKALDDFLRTGKDPKYPTGGAKPVWKSAAAFHPSDSYEEGLFRLQSSFVEAVGRGVADYVNTVNRRLSRDGNWNYGEARDRGAQTYSMTVYNEMSSSQGPEVLSVYFKFGGSIEVVARAEREPLFSKKLDPGKSASSIALMIGESWEKLVTGSVDYGY